MSNHKIRYTMWIILSLVALAAAVAAFMHSPAFGRLLRGERLARIKRSPNYRNGEFRNREAVPMMTSDKGMLRNMVSMLRRNSDIRPDSPVDALRTDLHALDPARDAIVWFGHSSYMLRRDGIRFLIDPVFAKAAPVGFVNRPFAGTDIYRPDDVPDIDYLIITHDHWDHLDYATVKALRPRTHRVICPLGVGEHFERWGFPPEQVIEADWDESLRLRSDLTVHCLPAQHFSGRGLRRNRTLWASFLIETPRSKTYIAGDGGYGNHFAEIGRLHPDIDLAIMENGQYSSAWSRIHLMPELMAQAARDIGARRTVTVHHLKYALAQHAWDEPLRNEEQMRAEGIEVIPMQIGRVTEL